MTDDIRIRAIVGLIFGELIGSAKAAVVSELAKLPPDVVIDVGGKLVGVKAAVNALVEALKKL